MIIFIYLYMFCQRPQYHILSDKCARNPNLTLNCIRVHRAQDRPLGAWWRWTAGRLSWSRPSLLSPGPGAG